MASTAVILYWYPDEQIPADGGGLRVRAWQDLLTKCGYAPKVVGLGEIGPDASRLRLRARVRAAVAPVPRERRRIPDIGEPELLVSATVASARAAARAASGTCAVVIDWFDTWSDFAKSKARSPLSASAHSQAILWSRRERALASSGITSTFAGYSDWARLDGRNIERWLPTPIQNNPVSDRSDATRHNLTLPTVGFLGNMNYGPNRHAVAQFLKFRGGLPASERPNFVLAGYGSAGYELNVRQDGVEVLGTLSDLSAFYSRVDAVVAPIDQGGGIKVKVLEAFAHGVPVLGTEHVRSGLPPELRQFVVPYTSVSYHNLTDVPAMPTDLFHEYFSEEMFMRKGQLAIERALKCAGN